ncbi:MAG: hypothetical protein FWD13_05340 [Treponema sp.]|nr:hypothetical protein [Treponema sp.]
MKTKTIFILFLLFLFFAAAASAYSGRLIIDGVQIDINAQGTGVTFINNAGRTVPIEFVVHWDDGSRRIVRYSVAQSGGGLTLFAPRIGVKISSLSYR